MIIYINVLCYNESIMLPMFHKWYSKRFPSAQFIVYDNYSTDGSAHIAVDLGMSVLRYDSDDKLSDLHFLAIKNNSFKHNKGWNIVIDMDEWLDITEQDLIDEHRKGTSIISTVGYNMANVDALQDYTYVDKGIYEHLYSKLVCINSSMIEEMNYRPGAHTASPIGNVKYSDRKYTLRHMIYMDVENMIQRYKLFDSRRNDHNRANAFGTHYQKNEDQIRAEFAKAHTLAKLVP